MSITYLKSVRLITPRLFLTCLLGLTLTHQLRAHEGAAHQGATSEPSDHAHGEVKFITIGHAWAAIQDSINSIDSALAAKNLEPVHAAEEKLTSALKFLQGNSSVVTGDKAKRLDSALKQALTQAANVHAASDAKDQVKTESEFKKLQGALKLVEVNYPAEALAAPIKAAAVQTHCPVSTRPLGSMGTPVSYQYKEGKNSRTLQFCCSGCEPRFKANPAVYLAKLEEMSHEGAGHAHGVTQPTMKLSASSTKPLQVGEKAEVTVKLTNLQGQPVSLSDLMEAHTEKVHLLVIDPSLTDYHHEHPKPTAAPGEYRFSFTPRKPGSYRIWADVVSQSSGMQEYVMTDLLATTQAEPIAQRSTSLQSKLDGLTYTITFDKPILKKGEAAMGTLTITDPSGKIFTQLEPVMGAYAHLVGFVDDYKTISHIHPMGVEPSKASDRGEGKLQFHLQPDQSGLMRLFSQVQIGGENKFVPFTLEIKP